MIYLNNDISKSNVLFTALGWTDRKCIIEKDCSTRKTLLNVHLNKDV